MEFVTCLLTVFPGRGIPNELIAQIIGREIKCMPSLVAHLAEPPLALHWPGSGRDWRAV